MKCLSFLALLPLAASIRLYSIPKELVASQSEDCYYPEQFSIQKFSTFTKAASNQTSVGFTFVDSGSKITTACQKNSTSLSTSQPGLAARYACDNSLIHFIWQSNKLTLIEATACSGSSKWEASGSLAPLVSCTATNCTSVTGDGKQCTALNSTLVASFTSFNPAAEAE